MEISDSKLIITSIVLALLGIGALATLLLVVELPHSQLTVVEELPPDAPVRLRARVVAARQVKNVTILELSQEVQQKAVIFEPVPIQEGSLVDITGRVAEYRGEREVIVESLRLVE